METSLFWLPIIIYNFVAHFSVIAILSITLYVLFRWSRGEAICTAIFSSIIGSCLLLLTNLICMYYFPYITHSVSRSIISIRDDSSIHGSFFLRSGTIDGTNYYVFYEKISKNSFQQNKVSAEVTMIEENDDVVPQYSYVLHQVNRQYLYGISKYLFIDDISGRYDQKITVPVGTIIKEFKLQ